MPLFARDVAKFIALENKLSKFWQLINITNILKYKEEATDFKNSTLLWGYVQTTLCQIRNNNLGSYLCDKKDKLEFLTCLTLAGGI